jgi:hypothetical protein
MRFRDMTECVRVHCTNRRSVNEHIGDMIARIRRDRETLIRAVFHRHITGRRDAAVDSGGRRDGVGVDGKGDLNCRTTGISHKQGFGENNKDFF